MVFQFLPHQDPSLKSFEEATAPRRQSALLLWTITDRLEHLAQWAQGVVVKNT